MNKIQLLDIIKHKAVFAGVSKEESYDAFVMILAAVMACYENNGHPRNEVVESYVEMVKALYSPN